MKKSTRIITWLLMLSLLLSCFSVLTAAQESEDTGSEAEETVIDENELKRLMRAENFVFRLPTAQNENLLSETFVKKGEFPSLTDLTRMTVLYNEGYKIDALDTAYVAYKLKNNSSEVLSIGTMIYFRTTGGNLCAYNLKPMVYDSKTGEKLDLVTSYEYSGIKNQFVLSETMPTVEIPAGSEVYMVIPFMSVSDPANYVPGVFMAEDDMMLRGFEPESSYLWSNNADRTNLMEEKLRRDGTTDCLQMQLFLGGNGSENGVRLYDGSFDFAVDSIYAISKEEYYGYAYDPNAPEEGDQETDAEKLEELMMAKNFKFQLPGEDATNLLSEDVEFGGAFSTGTILNVFQKSGKIDLASTAYVTYRVKNDSDQTLSLGSLVYFSTTGAVCCGLVTVPMVYDAATGEKLDVKTSYDYASSQFVVSGVLPTFEIPAGKDVYVVIPFTSVNHSTNYVPGMPMYDEPFCVGIMPEDGVLWSNNPERTQLMADKIARDGTTDCYQLQVYLGGNGADENGNRTYSGNYDFTISEYVAVSKDAYFAYAYDPDEEKPPIGEDPDGEMYTTVTLTDSGHALAPSFDVNGNLLNRLYTRKDFLEVARTLAKDGFNRVYVVTTRPGIPAASSASNQWNDPGDTKYTIAESIIVSGDPNFEFLYACKSQGLEVIAVYKPYEGGGVSKGEDADMSNSLFYEETVGGNWTSYDAFVSAHPEMRLSRKENAELDARVNDTVTKIEAAFILDSFTFKNWSNGRDSKVTINSENRTDIKLYVGKNNMDYEEYDGEYTVNFTVEKRRYYDENGWILNERGNKCLVATIDGIEIGEEYRYMALVMQDKTDRYIIPQSMIKIFNADNEEIPTTVGTTVRYFRGETERPDDYVWGGEDILRGTDPECLKYFESWGFEFDFDGNGSNQDKAYYSSYVYGIARGKFEYAKGTLCEAYDEVREYWLSEVRNLLTLGYDGIEIRLQAHSSMISDYAYYGFNEPLMQAYIEKYGTDPREEETVSKETAYNIATLRGEFFMEFMKEAEEMVHAEGKTFGLQMRSAMLETTMDGAMNTSLHQMFCWAMPKIVIDWKEAVDLCDTITIKQNFSNNYRPEMISELTTYAKEKGTKVWISAYTQQFTNVDEYGVQIGEANVDFVNKVFSDPNVYGVQIYEWDPYGSRFQHAFGILKKALNYIPRKVVNQDEG